MKILTSRLMRRVVVAAAAVLVSTTLAPAPVQAASELTLVPQRIVGGPGHAGLYGWGAATMRDGSVLVGDYWNMRVLRFAADGTPLGTFIQNVGFGPTQHQAPYGLAVDPDNGDVYVADTDRYQVDRYDEQGNYLNSFGESGKNGDTPGHFRYPSRVAVRNGQVFIADTWTHRIVVYSRTGTVEDWAYKAQGTKLGQMRSPHGISFDGQGRLHVVDSGNKRIQVFAVDNVNKKLVYLYKYGAAFDPLNPAPAEDAVFRGDLRGIAIDKATGVSYVVDAEGNRIHKFTVDGQILKTWGGLDTFTDGGREATVDGNGNLWVGDMPQFRVQVFSPEGDHLMSYPNPPQPPPPGGFNGPRGVAVDPSTGNMFVSDTYNFRVQKLAPDGTMLDEWGTRGRSEFEFNYTRLLAVDPTDGSVIICDTDNHRIKKYSSDGDFIWEIGKSGIDPLFFKNPHGIDIGPDGTIYVADTNNARVQVIAQDGSFVRFIGAPGVGNGQFRRPRGVVADDVTGEVYVADAVRKNVQVFSANGAYLRTIGTAGPQPMGAPFDVEVDGSYVYVADSSRNTIAVWGKDGHWVGEFGGGGVQGGKLSQPQGLDLVGDTLYIAEQANERISVWKVVAGDVPKDTTKPQTTVTSPTAGQKLSGRPVTLSGTASDNASLSKVQLALKDVGTGLYWDPATAAWRSGQLWYDAALTGRWTTSGTWSSTFDDSSAPGSGSYLLQKRGVDLVGNTEAVTGVAFSIQSASSDSQAPSSVITSPTASQTVSSRPVTVTGTATDDTAVTVVEVAIRDRATNTWWNPVTGAWSASLVWSKAALSPASGASVTWSYVFDDSAAKGSGGYYVQKRGKDAAGNTEAVVGHRFDVSG